MVLPNNKAGSGTDPALIIALAAGLGQYGPLLSCLEQLAEAARTGDDVESQEGNDDSRQEDDDFCFDSHLYLPSSPIPSLIYTDGHLRRLHFE